MSKHQNGWEIGPIQAIKRVIELADQIRGFLEKFTVNVIKGQSDTGQIINQIGQSDELVP